MKTSQRFIVLLFIAFAFFASDNARASHATAGYITYTYLSPSTYEVILTFYRDCAGVLAPASASISYNSSCGGGGTVVLLPVPGTGQQIPLSPFTVPANTACMGGTGYGAEEWKYSGIVVLPIACSDWTFSYSLCCRNPSNTTVGTGNFYIETMLNNLNVPINNSPVPFSHAVAEFCVGDPAIWNQNSTDVDGDSLVYSLVCPKTDSNSSVVYNPPYSCTNPIIASPQVSLNPISGQMAFLPTVQQISILAVKVDEYRGGVLIGSVVNSMQVYVSANNLCLFNIGSNNLIVGKTFIDGNQNGVCDSNETGFTSGVANFTNQANSFNSGLGFGGLFFGIVDTGSWTSSIDLFNTNYFSVSPDSIISNFGSQTGLIDTVNFAVQMIPGNPDLSIELLPLTPPVPGFNLWYGLVATNIGTDTITGDVQFTHDSLLTINSTTPLYDSYTNPVVTWNFTDFAPFQTQTYTIWFSVPAPPIVNLGDKLNSSVIINPVATDVDPSNNIDSINHEVIGAYDPNDKWVNRETILSNELPYADHLDYLIRFQNTGTDTAHSVIIRDTLD
ncbi:MAG: hypothetical protein KJO64_07940, partial [Bacteroidia bacterium]|nr:hypothetical protein [Bacteroidia bacterium]